MRTKWFYFVCGLCFGLGANIISALLYETLGVSLFIGMLIANLWLINLLLGIWIGYQVGIKEKAK